MITVKLNRPEFEYDIHSLVKAFYPSEDVYVSVADKKQSEQIDYHMDVCYDDTQIRFTFFQVMENGEEKQVAKAAADVNYEDRKETKNALKRSLYQMLSDYTNQKLP